MTSVRGYRDEDAEILRGLVRELQETLHAFDGDLAPADDILESYFNYLLRRVDESDGAIFLAEVQEIAVGHAIVYGRVQPDDPDERPDRFSFVAELFVRPQFRGRGIAQLLMERAEMFAREIGSYKVELNVLAANVEARRYYKHAGYAPRIHVLRKYL